MTLPEIAIQKKVTTMMVIAGVILLGTIAITRLPRELYPRVNFPQLTVVTNYLNAAPEEIESLITKPIEEAVGTVSGLRRVESVSREGKSYVTLSFDWGTNIDFAALGVREKIDLVKEKLPKEAEDPTVLKFDPLARPVMILSLSGNMSPVELKLIAENTVKDNLEKVLGVASAAISGGLDREILVEVDQGRLHAHKISILSVVDALEKANLSYPAGSVKKGLYEYLIRTMGEFQSVDEISYAVAGIDKSEDRRLKEDVFVERAKFGPRDTLEGAREEMKKERLKKRLILFREIGDVEDTFKEKTSVSRYNGKENISISIQKQAGANIIQVVDRVRAALADLKEELDSREVKLEIIYDQSTFIKDALNGVKDAGLQGGVLTVLVLLFFLKNIYASLIVAIAIPITIMGVFFLMFAMGISMNTMSLGGLALGVGMLLDNGICVIENIYRFRSSGEMTPEEAAIRASNEVIWPMFSSTLTTCAVFFPLLVFVPGVAGQLFKDLSWTVIFSQVLSWAVSLSVTPLFAIRIKIKPKEENSGESAKPSIFKKLFQKVQSHLLGMSPLRQNFLLARIILVAGVSFVGGLMIMKGLDREVLPKVDQGQFIIKVNMPVGTKLESTDEVATAVEKIILEIPDVASTAVSIGSSKESSAEAGAEALRSHQALILVNLKPERKRSSAAILEDLKDNLKHYNLKEAELEYILQESEFSAMGGGGKPVTVEIRGYDFKVLENYLMRTEAILREIPGVYGIQNDLAKPSPETKVEIDRRKAALYGISVRDIALTVKTALEGAVATQYKEGGREYDIRVKLREQDRNDLLRLGELLIHSPVFEGEVPLSEVAKLKRGAGPSEIRRKNQSRTITVTANISEGENKTAILDAFAKRLNEEFKNIPEGYGIEITGESLEVQESFSKIFFALVLSVVLIYMIMASQFESLMQPFVIMFTVPLCVIGAAIALWVSHTSLNAISLLGFILLGGVVVNNGIVLVEYINSSRSEGKDVLSAALHSVSIRTKPICMTAVSSVMGSIPLAIGLGGAGSAIQAPMAITTIGGLISSTILTLAVLPSVYVLVERASDVCMRHLFGVEEEEVT